MRLSWRTDWAGESAVRWRERRWCDSTISPLLCNLSFSLSLSSGAYGEVFKGTRKGDRADYAVKVMKKRKIDQDSIMREVDVLKKLSGHPGVVKLVDSFQTPKEYVLVMEL